VHAAKMDGASTAPAPAPEQTFKAAVQKLRQASTGRWAELVLLRALPPHVGELVVGGVSLAASLACHLAHTPGGSAQRRSACLFFQSFSLVVWRKVPGNEIERVWTHLLH
jgi:hypothetical protein